ncbi:MAG: 6,7-dimethyl-8-ribityllumazine synthase [Candidatus Muirbacterium halophilum]|nr:6,7-dimethyl-8-ribityllumazine synthase [Candidatus Muirbacterium halophilum]MCK9475025.1 6,7-dimethyl-8-ribityllumazine synthase [Candidatus Muirbacterium halophilum]
MKEINGIYEGKDVKVAIVASRFNSLIVEQLIKGAIDGLIRNGVNEHDIQLIKVPGAFEIPLIAKKIANSKKHDAIIALSAVIRGNTPHFDYVSAEVSKGIAYVGLETDIPVIFGVLTTDNTEQALERAGVKSGNKGFEAALTALETVSVLKAI